MKSAGAGKIIVRNWLGYQRYWRGALIFSFLNPILFLLAMGLGIGALVTRTSPEAFGEVGYLAFFSTGMLAATCMQTGVFESSFPIMAKMTWQKNYEAMLATPLQVANLVFGEIWWLCLRLLMVGVPFFLVMLGFGVAKQPMAPLAIPATVLCGVACGTTMMAYTATLDTDANFASVFRFVLTPLFLFSGTFFPLDQLPSWVGIVANLTPLYHGIELVRGFMLYGISLPEVALHAAYLVALLLISGRFAMKTFVRRLVT
jgi:lipooligosaccharide transport system permease protein